MQYHAGSVKLAHREPVGALIFRRFGLFVVEGFFDRDLCGKLRADMRAGVSTAGTAGSHGWSSWSIA
jgi:hypothetical protein